MRLIDGKQIASIMKEEIRQQINELFAKGIVPTLAIIQVGDNPSSNIYIRNKMKLLEGLNCKNLLYRFPDTISEEELIQEIHKLNNDKNINGVLVQLPLTKQINEEHVLDEISPEKDVDCFTLKNVGKLWTAKKHDISLKNCTPAAVIELLKRSKVNLDGANVVIVGRSNIVGKPLAGLLLLENATVTICHSHTKNLAQICSNADILIAAIGSPKFFNKNFVKQGATVIDVGINRLPDNKTCGDVDFEDVKDKVDLITPVPGGVGPMTVMMVLINLINLTKSQKGIA
ncbi:MAG: bifunctional methylenetetrahydrofolate dehydrogenase/methenyltetrahydrofolate cyclohydrolase [Mycoplasma sp.]|nr:bifunctional methylenetetrahydrofolate dehydrogenase/methenyltetrahydrofolate cyclohydrolase [Mycoplasma sp.]MBQ6280375.1 bifunctional methylenetetrahydrofolate dehydrogenase/methenyltetrahydrofolate cyclohydrolase [Mycoplasma sp.]